MTIVLPQNLVINQTKFELSLSVQRTPLRGGGGLSIDYAPARWVAEFSTPTQLYRDDLDPIIAFVDSLRGGVVQAEIFDMLRMYPKKYGKAVTSLLRAAGGGFDGTATVTGTAARTISLSGLPAAFVASQGDMIGLKQSAARSLHRIQSTVTANSSGVVTVTVEPPIATAVFTSPTANLVAPTAIMTLTEASSTDRVLDREGISFKMIQVPF